METISLNYYFSNLPESSLVKSLSLEELTPVAPYDRQR
jgi:hypothetical protein